MKKIENSLLKNPPLLSVTVRVISKTAHSSIVELRLKFLMTETNENIEYEIILLKFMKRVGIKKPY